MGLNTEQARRPWRPSAALVVALVSLAGIGWLYFSKPTFHAYGFEAPLSCTPVGWTGSDRYSLISGLDDDKESVPLREYAEKYQETMKDTQAAYERGCDLARQERQTQIVIVSTIAATTFVTVSRRRPGPPPDASDADDGEGPPTTDPKDAAGRVSRPGRSTDTPLVD